MNLSEALECVLDNGFKHIKVVAIDLDETLGHEGGWVKGSLQNYVTNEPALKEAIKMLRRRGLKVFMVSRNSAFCGGAFNDAKVQVSVLGFDDSLQCPRTKKADKATLAALAANVDVKHVLLIDDLRKECFRAAHSGGQAIWIPHGPAVVTIPQCKFYFIVPAKNGGARLIHV